MLKRSGYLQKLRGALKRSRAVALLGPRQCGKTTLARELVGVESPNYFDLEDPESLSRLNDPKIALEQLQGLVVIDEVQRRPELFPVLRVMLDRKPLPAKFLILGSASPDLLRQSSETLAGRLETVGMGGFALSEVGIKHAGRLWQRGGFPLSFLAQSERDSFAWRKNFIQMFLERDLRQQGITIPMIALHRFWAMLAHNHGLIWNAAGPAGSLGVSEPTVRRYLDILTGVFMVRQLQPWHANLKKRQVKAPKVYIRDSGLLHALLGLKNEADLLRHPRCGTSWEGYVIEEVIRSVEPNDAYFWATHNGAEIDLILSLGGRLYGVECKRAAAPAMTPSMRIALEDLGLERIVVIYPGKQKYQLHKRIEVLPLETAAAGLQAIMGKSPAKKKTAY
ncbi:ATP-binding protein [candidate division FCPU426 bacterium]|nr:ATP-binding protein [candidate division FCPU426 bacterium]